MKEAYTAASYPEVSRMLPSHGTLRFVTSHSRFALVSVRKTGKRSAWGECSLYSFQMAKQDIPLSSGYTLIGKDVGIGDGGTVALLFTQNEILDKWVVSPVINTKDDYCYKY